MDTSFSESIKVFAKKNNIYYTLPDNKIIQTTFSKNNHDPVLSPDKKMIAFIRESSRIAPKGCDDFADLTNNHPTQIWIYNIKIKKEYLLISNNFTCDTPERKIIDPHNLQFSPDSKKLYFLTSAWATSGALHDIEFNKKNPRYLMPALDYKVLQNGKQKGYLLVQQHKYYNQGSSFEWSGLFNPQGKEQANKSLLTA